MRWSATCLAVCMLTLVSTGCGMFGKKKPEATTDAQFGTQGGYSDLYPSYQPQGQTVSQDYSATTPTAGGSRYHTVQKKDTLYSLARQYYGDDKKWREIYNANRSDIGDPNRIKVGQRLMIP